MSVCLSVCLSVSLSLSLSASPPPPPPVSLHDFPLRRAHPTSSPSVCLSRSLARSVNVYHRAGLVRCISQKRRPCAKCPFLRNRFSGKCGDFGVRRQHPFLSSPSTILQQRRFAVSQPVPSAVTNAACLSLPARRWPYRLWKRETDCRTAARALIGLSLASRVLHKVHSGYCVLGWGSPMTHTRVCV